ncbi:MAG: hypothetical protein IPF42_11955 [Candidatus Microthrix sp.]|nr:hypothetical protein [Candidatus Microthrix sp.]
MSPDQLLDAARRRVRAVLAGRVVVRFAWMAALCALAGVLAARWIAWRPTELLALVVPAAAVVGWAAWRASRPIPASSVANVVDRGLASHGALGAYLEFAEGSPQFSSRIVDRAATVADTAELKRAVPTGLIGPRHEVGRYLSVAGVAVLCAVGLAFADNPQDAAREQRQREAEAVERAGADLEAAAKELGADSCRRKLKSLAKDLQTLDAPQATEALANAEAELSTEAGVNLDSALAATAGLDRSVEARPLPGASDPSDAAPGDAAGQLAEAAACWTPPARRTGRSWPRGWRTWPPPRRPAPGGRSHGEKLTEAVKAGDPAAQGAGGGGRSKGSTKQVSGSTQRGPSGRRCCRVGSIRRGVVRRRKQWVGRCQGPGGAGRGRRPEGGPRKERRAGQGKALGKDRRRWASQNKAPVKARVLAAPRRGRSLPATAAVADRAKAEQANRAARARAWGPGPTKPRPKPPRCLPLSRRVRSMGKGLSRATVVTSATTSARARHRPSAAQPSCR